MFGVLYFKIQNMSNHFVKFRWLHELAVALDSVPLASRSPGPRSAQCWMPGCQTGHPLSPMSPILTYDTFLVTDCRLFRKYIHSFTMYTLFMCCTRGRYFYNKTMCFCISQILTKCYQDLQSVEHFLSCRRCILGGNMEHTVITTCVHRRTLNLTKQKYCIMVFEKNNHLLWCLTIRKV